MPSALFDGMFYTAFMLTGIIIGLDLGENSPGQDTVRTAKIADFSLRRFTADTATFPGQLKLWSGV